MTLKRKVMALLCLLCVMSCGRHGKPEGAAPAGQEGEEQGTFQAVPTTLEECFEMLDEELDDVVKAEVEGLTDCEVPGDVGKYLGATYVERWHLDEEGSPLAQSFRARGVDDPRSMADTIFVGYVHHLEKLRKR